MIRTVFVMLMTLAVFPVLTGCGSNGCGDGRDTADGLVSDYLAAAVKASEAEDVCPFVDERNQEAALVLAKQLAREVESAGGVEGLTINVDPSRRMGSTHTVVVTSNGDLLKELVVEEVEGRFYLLPEMNTL